MVSCESETLMAGQTCGCPQLTLPIDMAHPVMPEGDASWLVNIWPFGVHGGGHPEGHPGWDFTLTADQPVLMPADGTVYEATPSSAEDPQGVDVGIALACGLRLYFTPMRPDPSLVVAGKVLRRGDRLGSMAIVNGRYFVHFGLASRARTPTSPTTACPAVLFDSATTALMRALVDQSSFAEKLARTNQVACAGGEVQAFDLPAEGQLCNERLAEPTRSRLTACLALGPERAVW